jgi:hypothetical protein
MQFVFDCIDSNRMKGVSGVLGISSPCKLLYTSRKEETSVKSYFGMSLGAKLYVLDSVFMHNRVRSLQQLSIKLAEAQRSNKLP